MKFKSITSIIIIVCMLLGSMTSLAHVGYENDIIAREDFNGYLADEVPGGSITVSASGSGMAVVASKPDSANKSLHMTTSDSDDSVSISFGISNAQSYPLSIAFKIYLPSAQSLSLPSVVCSEGEVGLMTCESDSTVFAAGKWHSAELLLSSSGKSVTAIVDGKIIADSKPVEITAPTAVKFAVSGEAKEIYIDDICISKSSTGGNVHDYYNTNLFLSDDNYHIANDVLQTAVIMNKNHTSASLGGKKMVLPIAPFDEGGVTYVPVRIIAEALGAEVTWQPSDEAAMVIYGGKKALFIPGSANADIDGTAVALSGAAVLKEGNICVPAADLASLMNREYYSEYGFIFIGADTDKYLGANEYVKDEVKNGVKYTRPSGDEVLSDVVKTHPDKSHPRLLAADADFEEVKSLIKTDATAAGMYAYLKGKADDMLATSAAEFSLKEVFRLGDAGTLMPDRVYTLALIWRLSDDKVTDKKYAARAWEELEALCSFDNWNEQHYLDTASLLTAAAIGYDWLYDYMTDSQKLTLRTAIVEKGLDKGLAYMTGSYVSPVAMSGWYTSAFNWNPYCNSAIIMASLAIGDEADVDVSQILGYSMRSIEHNLNEYEPDGGWEEGIGYWNDTVYSLVRIINSLETAAGTDYGYLNADGIKETCYYYFYMLGPAGAFNYGDSAPMAEMAVESQFWMAKRLNDPYLGIQRKNYIIKNNYKCEAADLLWYNPKYCTETAAELETDKYFRKIETVTMRSSWENDALFAGLHSGRFTNHSHYDTGSFVLDWGGERWAYETGTDRVTYTGVAASDVYRTRAEGHNTIVIDSSPYPNYAKDSDGRLEMMSMDFDDVPVGNEPDLEVSNKGSGTTKAVAEDAAGNHTLRLACDSAATGHQALVQQVISAPYINNGITINFRVMRENLNGDVFMPEIQAKSDGDTLENFSALKFGADGMLYYKTSAADYTALGSYSANTWYDFSVKLDIVNQTMSVLIGGYEEVSDVPLPITLSNVFFVRFAMYRKATALRLDDISLYVDPADEQTIVATVNTNQQNVNAVCLIDRFETSSDGVIAVTDMTDAYSRWAKSAVRGVKLSNNRTSFTVRDEITLKQKADIYWFAHISSDTAVDFTDDFKSAVLTKDGKKMWVGIVSGTDAVLECVDAVPLPSSPNPDGQADNSAYKKLRIKLAGVTSADFSVKFIPLSGDATSPEASLLTDSALADWTIQ